jgi:hypothetical protein
MLAEPTRPWRILSSHRHSTVWDGENTLFDINFLGLGVSATECFKLASLGGEELPPGRLRPTWMTADYLEKLKRDDPERYKALNLPTNLTQRHPLQDAHEAATTSTRSRVIRSSSAVSRGEGEQGMTAHAPEFNVHVGLASP